MSKINIESNAYIRMFSHVLRFGSEALEESLEVMGLCIGNYDEVEDKFNLINVIPYQHGIKVSTGFTKEDLEFFSNLNKEYQDRDLKIIGWYLSRPGWGLDFTDITIQNHRLFQTEKNPQNFVIIFDHSRMGTENDFGFKIYSLRDFKKSNDYIEMPYDISIPDNLNFFKWVQKFVEDSQKQSPVIIKEVKEAPLRDLQEIPVSTESLIEASIKDYSTEVEYVFSGFKEGITKLNEVISGTYQPQINSWIKDMTQGTLKGWEYISRTINQLKLTLSEALGNVQKYFDHTFNEISSLFKRNITEYIEKRVKGQQELKSELSSMLDNNINELKSIIMEQISNSLNHLQDESIKLLETVNQNSEINSKLGEIVIELNTLVSENEKSINDLTSNIGEQIEKVMNPFKNIITEKSEELGTELKPIQETFSEIKILLDKLQKIITDFRNLT
ncbi:MAG: hypothetical protein ACFFDB_13690 [Promethearchaeota archaeon]